MREQYRKKWFLKPETPGRKRGGKSGREMQIVKTFSVFSPMIYRKKPRSLPQLSFYYMCQKYANTRYSFMQPVDMNVICSNENLPIAPICSVSKESMSEIATFNTLWSQ